MTAGLDASRSFQRRPAAAEELCELVRGLGAQGLCQGTSGNFSVVVRRRPLRLLISRSGRHKAELVPDDLVEVDGRGRPRADDGDGPSAEVLLHCALVRRTGAGAVFHTHSVTGTLLGERFLDRSGFTVGGYEMLKGLAGIQSHEERVFVPVIANSQDMEALGGEVEGLLEARPGLHGFLLAGHGLYTWGAAPDEARRHVEIFEFLFECLARRVAFEPFTG